MKPAPVKPRVFRADMSLEEKAAYEILDRLRDRSLLEGVLSRCGGVPVDAIVGRSRSKSIVRARHAVWRWMHDDQLGPQLSWPEIGALFGRHHTTAMNASTKREHEVEQEVAEKIAAWLSHDAVGDEDPRAFVDVVDRELMAARIRAGDWR